MKGSQAQEPREGLVMSQDKAVVGGAIAVAGAVGLEVAIPGLITATVTEGALALIVGSFWPIAGLAAVGIGSYAVYKHLNKE
jgi:hypothetical protein